MFIMMQVHGLRVNVRLKCRVVVGQRRNFMCHSDLSSSWQLMRGNESWFQNCGRDAMPHPVVIIEVWGSLGSEGSTLEGIFYLSLLDSLAFQSCDPSPSLRSTWPAASGG